MRTSTTELSNRVRRDARRIFVLGDSHIHAVKEALNARGLQGTVVPIEARRLFKTKQVIEPTTNSPGRQGWLPHWARRRLRRRTAVLGDISFEEGIKAARALGPDDVLVSVIGGNQHAVFSTIQHSQPFDFMLPARNERILPAVANIELIPFRILLEYFSSWLRQGDGGTIRSLRRSTKARMVHLVAPPPKRDNGWIEQHHDTLFASEGIGRLGVSAPELRMKFWRLQNFALREICSELGIEVFDAPQEACDSDGFLVRDCYAGDATHANVRYGELVLQQLEERFTNPKSSARADS